MCYCVRRGRPRSESLARSGRTQCPAPVDAARGHKCCRVQVRLGRPVWGRDGALKCADTAAPCEEFEETCFPWEPLSSPGNGPGCTSRALGGHPRHPVFPTVLRCSQEPGPFHSASSLCHHPCLPLHCGDRQHPPARPGQLLHLPPALCRAAPRWGWGNRTCERSGE